jgi:hypothetical protein
LCVKLPGCSAFVLNYRATPNKHNIPGHNIPGGCSLINTLWVYSPVCLEANQGAMRTHGHLAAGSWLGIRVCLTLALTLAAPVSGLSTGTVGVARRAAVHGAVRRATTCSAQEVPSSLSKVASATHSQYQRTLSLGMYSLASTCRSRSSASPRRACTGCSSCRWLRVATSSS